jgi:hypothetical protein
MRNEGHLTSFVFVYFLSDKGSLLSKTAAVAAVIIY